MIANLRNYVVVVCRHCGDAVTPREWARVCLCGRTDVLADEETGDVVVESKPPAATQRFPS